MGNISACRQAIPQSVYILLATEAAPAIVHIALIAHLVENDWLLVNIPHYAGCPQLQRCMILNTGMGIFIFPIGIIIGRITVNGTHVPVRVIINNDFCKEIPIGRLIKFQEIIFVCQRPPHIAESTQACHHIFEIAFTHRQGQRSKFQRPSS